MAEQVQALLARLALASAFARVHSSALGTRGDFIELDATRSAVLFGSGAARAFSRQKLTNGAPAALCDDCGRYARRRHLLRLD